MAATTVFVFYGSTQQFNTAAATTGTALNTNLAAGYLLQTVVEVGEASDGTLNFMWVLQTGGTAL